MKNMKKKLFIVISFLLIFLSIYTYSIADVGSFDRYDSGSSDWGSSGSSWDFSSSDWGSSDGDIGFLIGLLLGSTPGRGVLLILIIGFVIRYFIRRKGHNKPPMYRPNPYGNVSNPVYNNNINNYAVGIGADASHQVARNVKQVDEMFSEEKFLAYTKDLFVKLQNSWTARDWDSMRPFESQELFAQHQTQVQGYIDTNRINIMDRIAVNFAYLYKFRQDGDKEILEVALKSTMKDYIIDATTKEVLEGNKTQDRITTYKMTFERKKGVKTKEGTNDINTTNCPNCGAPTQITSSGKCNYCGSVITTGDYGWVLSGLEPFRT